MGEEREREGEEERGEREGEGGRETEREGEGEGGRENTFQRITMLSDLQVTRPCVPSIGVGTGGFHSFIETR